MLKFTVVIFAVIACTAAAPGFIGDPLAYAAPAAVVAAPAPVVTATSSQYIARNHNGIATAPFVAPVAVGRVFNSAVPLAFSAPLTYASAPAPAPAPAPVLL